MTGAVRCTQRWQFTKKKGILRNQNVKSPVYAKTTHIVTAPHGVAHMLMHMHITTSLDPNFVEIHSEVWSHAATGRGRNLAIPITLAIIF